MQYADSGINYAGKSFMKLAKGVNFIKLFWGIIDVPIAVTFNETGHWCQFHKTFLA
jgi:hypothetical protein